MFKDNEPDGYGMFKYYWGGLFFGHLKDHTAQGEGTLIDENGDTLCEGNFVNNWIIYNGKHPFVEKFREMYVF